MTAYFILRWSEDESRWLVFRVFVGAATGFRMTEFVGRCARWSAPRLAIKCGSDGAVIVEARRLVFDTAAPDLFAFAEAA
jgi:hypothetical protein